MKNKFLLIIFPVLLLTPLVLFAATAKDFTPGKPITLGWISDLIDTIARFLIQVSIFIAVIAIIWAGILWTTAGSSDRSQKAKDWLKNGIIGALVILGVGVILQTGLALVTGDFFNGGGGGGGSGPGNTTTQPQGRKLGQSCKLTDPNLACQSGLVCIENVCKKSSGNEEGDICTNDSDCETGLVCKQKEPGKSLTRTCQE